MEQSKKHMLEVPDANTLKEFQSNARAAWLMRYPESKKKRGRKAFDRKVYKLVTEAWLELRDHEGMTQYKIAQRAWRKDKSISAPTYKKYTSEFVTLLALAGNRVQLNDNDKMLLANATDALTKKVDRYHQALFNMTEQGEKLIVPSSEILGDATAELYESILQKISKNNSLLPPQ